MQQTTNYNLLIPEGTDIVNPLTQVNPNFQTIDGAMFANKQASIGTASEVVTGTVHAIIRNNTDSDVFRFTATGAWTAGDTMTLDGQSVTVHLSDGTTPATNSYIIGAEVLAMVNGSLVTLAISSTPPAQGVTSFNSRTGAVVPAASDYDASMIDYDNTVSGLTSTDVQSAIDELAGVASDHGLYEVWVNPDPTSALAPGSVSISTDKTFDSFFVDYTYSTNTNYTYLTACESGGTARCATFSSDGAGHYATFNREVTISQLSDAITITFGAGTVLTILTYGTQPSSTTDNSRLIPRRVFGVVHNN